MPAHSEEQRIDLVLWRDDRWEHFERCVPVSGINGDIIVLEALKAVESLVWQEGSVDRAIGFQVSVAPWTKVP